MRVQRWRAATFVCHCAKCNCSVNSRSCDTREFVTICTECEKKAPYRRRTVSTSVSTSWMTQLSCGGSSLGTRAGCTVKNRKSNKRLRSERREPSLSREKGAGVRPKTCSLVPDIHGAVPGEFVPGEQVINTLFYCKVLTDLREAIRHKRPKLWRGSNWMLHCDNAPVQRTRSVSVFQPQPNHHLPHLPYLQDWPLQICLF